MMNHFLINAASAIIGNTPSVPNGAIDPANFNTRVASAISLVLSLSMIIAVAYIILGGITYVRSEGNADKVKMASATVSNAVLGLVVAFSAFVIVRVVGLAVGVTDFSFTL